MRSLDCALLNLADAQFTAVERIDGRNRVQACEVVVVGMGNRQSDFMVDLIDNDPRDWSALCLTVR